jgi:hypothetical protein
MAWKVSVSSSGETLAGASTIAESPKKRTSIGPVAVEFSGFTTGSGKRLRVGRDTIFGMRLPRCE